MNRQMVLLNSIMTWLILQYLTQRIAIFQTGESLEIIQGTQNLYRNCIMKTLKNHLNIMKSLTVPCTLVYQWTKTLYLGITLVMNKTI